jgi:hypothetical protein
MAWSVERVACSVERGAWSVERAGHAIGPPVPQCDRR